MRTAGCCSSERWLALDKHPIVQRGGATLVSLWTGDREIATLTRWMETLRPGFVIVPGPVGIVVKAPAVEVQALVEEMSTQSPPCALDLAASGATRSASTTRTCLGV